MNARCRASGPPRGSVSNATSRRKQRPKRRCEGPLSGEIDETTTVLETDGTGDSGGVPV